MAKQETFISEQQATWRTVRFVGGAIFWIAVGAIPSWHFATEHAQLENFTESATVQVATMTELSKPITVPNHVAMDVIARAAGGKH